MKKEFMSQTQAPIYEALERFREMRVVPFDVPGHTIQLALNMFMKHNFNLITRYRVAEQRTGIRFPNL